MTEYRFNYVLDIATPTPKRLTTYTGRTATGARGLVVGGLYYVAALVEWPRMEESDTTAPLQIEISVGNAENAYTSLFSDKANHGKAITIRRVVFSGDWSEALPPTFTLETYFEGITGRPSLRGERLVIECHADMGRRGRTPRTRSRSLMQYTRPISANQKIVVISR